MSTFTAFERAKISRFINVYGNSFTFKRSALNDCGEPTGEYNELTSISGVYHEASGPYVSETSKDGSRYIRASEPMILCLQGTDSNVIMPDDIVDIGSRRYSVVRLKAVGGFGYAWDISLRLVDDGSNI